MCDSVKLENLGLFIILDFLILLNVFIVMFMFIIFGLFVKDWYKVSYQFGILFRVYDN